MPTAVARPFASSTQSQGTRSAAPTPSTSAAVARPVVSPTQFEGTRSAAPTPSTSAIIARPVVPPTQYQGPRNSGEREVQHFLHSCKPGMDRYLPAFIAFGCCDQDYLKGMSHWDDDRLHHTLELIIQKGSQLATGDVSHISEMDLLCLKYHFSDSFHLAS